MNAQIRAVRAAERQLRGFPAAVAAILGAERIAARFEPPLEWAEAAPLGTLAGKAASSAAREGVGAGRPRSTPPEPPRGAAGGGGAAAAVGGTLAGVQRVVEGIGEAIGRGAAAAGPAGGPGTPREEAAGIGAALGSPPGSALLDALAGRRDGSGTEEARPVFSLGALGKRAASVAAGEAGGRRAGQAADVGAGASLAAALGGREPLDPRAVAAVAGGVGIAAVQAAGAAATVVEALVPAMEGISRRIEAADARVAEARSAEAAASAAAAGAGGGHSKLAAVAAAATRAFADLAPAELTSTRAPTLEGQVEPTSPAPATRAAGSSGAAPQVVDAEWVVSVVGDALLEQARRQGIDLT